MIPISTYFNQQRCKAKRKVISKSMAENGAKVGRKDCLVNNHILQWFINIACKKYIKGSYHQIGMHAEPVKGYKLMATNP
jgi:hypothetical protein